MAYLRLQYEPFHIAIPLPRKGATLIALLLGCLGMLMLARSIPEFVRAIGTDCAGCQPAAFEPPLTPYRMGPTVGAKVSTAQQAGEAISSPHVPGPDLSGVQPLFGAGGKTGLNSRGVTISVIIAPRSPAGMTAAPHAGMLSSPGNPAILPAWASSEPSVQLFKFRDGEHGRI